MSLGFISTNSKTVTTQKKLKSDDDKSNQSNDCKTNSIGSVVVNMGAMKKYVITKPQVVDTTLKLKNIFKPKNININGNTSQFTLFYPLLVAYTHWGLYISFVHPFGWTPNDEFNNLNENIQRYLFPSVVAFSTGFAIENYTTGIVCVFAILGAVQGTNVPMILLSVLIALFISYTVRIFKLFIQLSFHKDSQFVQQFICDFFNLFLSVGVILLFNIFVEEVIPNLVEALYESVKYLNEAWSPLLSIIHRPAHFLYLDMSIINYLDAQAVTNSPMYYFISANIGPQIGLLMSFLFISKTKVKIYAILCLMLVFFGGINELYIPFVFMHPLSLIAMIASDSISIMMFHYLNVSLNTVVYPCNIFRLIKYTNNIGMMIVILLVGAFSAFLINILLIRPRTFSILKRCMK